MNKKQLAVLEKAWEADLAHALKEHRYPIFQSKSKVAKQLADDWYLELVEFYDEGVTIKGYRITHLGIMTYCESLPYESESPRAAS